MNVPAAYVGCGGRFPIAGHFQKFWDTTPVLIGFGKDDDAIHFLRMKNTIGRAFTKYRSGARIWMQ